MRSLMILLSLVVVAVPAFGQARVSAIVGTITDPDGHRVASAPVQVRNVDSATVYKASTTISGDYTLTRLPAGTYVLVVPAIGFTLDRFERKSIVIEPAQTLRVDIRLQSSRSTASDAG